jgi:putative flippase GtrA
MTRQFASFVVAGGIAAAVNIFGRYFLNFVMTYEIAIVVAYVLGVTTAFLLNLRFVFPATSRAYTTKYAKFVIVNIVALGQVWLVSVGLAHYAFPAIGFTWYANDVAHVIGVGSPVITSYFAHKYFSFA